MEPAQLLELFLGKGRAQWCDGVTNTNLLHAYHVRSTFHDIEKLLFGTLAPGGVHAEKDLRLMEEETVGTIDVFRAFLQVLVHGACGIADDASEAVTDGNGHAVMIESVFIALVADGYQVHLLHQLDGEAFLFGEVDDTLPVAVGISYAEHVNLFLAPACHRIAECSLRLRSVCMQALDEVFLDMVEDDEGSLLLAVKFFLLWSGLTFLHLYLLVEAFGQFLACLWEGHALFLHDETDGVTTLATDKAMADAFRRTHKKRRVIVCMERTDAFVVHTALLQIDAKLLDHFPDVQG